jgi:tripartite-type tricarboxylate transporter receptor subunit TctC
MEEVTMVINVTKSWIGVVVTAMTFMAASAEVAMSDAFYKDKTIRILTSSSGSGYDTTARLVARHLPPHLEGNPTIVVQSMPGATVKVPLYLYNVVPTDSTVIGALNNAVAFAPLLGVLQADFDATKFNWLGSPTTETGLVLVWNTVPVKTIEDATRREVIMGVGGGGSSATFYGRLFNSVLGTKFKLLPGYSGMGEALLAMERGETEGFPSTLWNSLKATKPEWIAEKKVRFLMQYGRKPLPELPGVPLARNLAKNDEDRMLIDAAIAPLEIGRPFAMAPKAAAVNVQLMKIAMMATFRDPAFAEDAKKQRFDVDADPKNGDDLLKIVADVYGAPQSVRDRLVALYKIEEDKRK